MPDVNKEMVGLSDGATLWTASTRLPRAGAHAMVFVHGGAGMWDYLGPVADMVCDSWNTLRYDQRGCGRSSPDADYRMARSIADLEELRRHFGYERWYVFGHSFGATLGLEYAASHPDRVAALMYCSGVGLGWRTHRATYKARQRERLGVTSHYRLRELEGRERTWDEEVEWRTLSWLADFADPARARTWARADAETPLPLNVACNRAFNAELAARDDVEERARYSAVSTRVLIVHGREDPRPIDGPRALASVLPHADFHDVAGAGHQPWRERPDQLAAILTALR